MANSITIETIAFDNLVAVDQVVTIAHKPAAEPDTNFVVDTTVQDVTPGGVLQPSYTIVGLLADTHYTVRVSNSCGIGEVAYITLKTEPDPCPGISNIYGVVN